MVSKKRALVSSIAAAAMLTGSGVSANPLKYATAPILLFSCLAVGNKLLSKRDRIRLLGLKRRTVKAANEAYNTVKSGGKIDSKFLSDNVDKVVTPDLEDKMKWGEVFNVEDDLLYNTSKDRVDGIYRFNVNDKVFYFSFVAFSNRIGVVLEESREKVSDLVKNMDSKISLNHCRKSINKIEDLDDTLFWTKHNLLRSVIRRLLPDDCSVAEDYFFIKDYLVPVFDEVLPIGGRTVIRFAKEGFVFEKLEEELGKMCSLMVG